MAQFGGNRLDRVTTDGQLTSLTGFPGRFPEPGAAADHGRATGNTLWATLDNPNDPGPSHGSEDREDHRRQGAGLGGPPPAWGGPYPVRSTPPLGYDAAHRVSAVSPLRRRRSRAGTKSIPACASLSASPAPRPSSCRERAPGQAPRQVVRQADAQAAQGEGVHAARARQDPQPERDRGPEHGEADLKGQRRGSYVVVLTAADTAGNKAAPAKRTLTITKKRPRSAPGLGGAAVRAGHRGRDLGVEGVAARAGVEGRGPRGRRTRARASRPSARAGGGDRRQVGPAGGRVGTAGGLAEGTDSHGAYDSTNAA